MEQRRENNDCHLSVTEKGRHYGIIIMMTFVWDGAKENTREQTVQKPSVMEIGNASPPTLSASWGHMTLLYPSVGSDTNKKGLSQELNTTKRRYSPVPAKWCPRQQRQRCTTRMSWGTVIRNIIGEVYRTPFKGKNNNSRVWSVGPVGAHLSGLANIGQCCATHFPRNCIPR